MAAAALVAGLLVVVFGEPESLLTGTITWVATTGGGVVEGLAIALFTYPLLQGWLPQLRRQRWVGATVGVTLLGWALGSAPSTIVAGALGGLGAGPEQSGSAAPAEPSLTVILPAGAVGGLLLGAVFGAAQGWALRPHLAHPWRWIPVNAVGWALALAVIMLGATSAPAGLPWPWLLCWGAVTGVLAGLTIGTVTGFFLPTLDQQAPRASTWVNRLVLGILRSPAHRLLSGALLEIDYVGRRSGTVYALPAQYARDGHRLVVWPGHPEKKRWWRNFTTPTDVDVRLQGAASRASGHVVGPGAPGYAGDVSCYAERFPKHAPAEGDPLVELELVHSSG
ncbi:MAG: hypothetical protein WAN48_14495 [Actinomycetes bacterium]